jgi:uncharacterized OB-fold protein
MTVGPVDRDAATAEFFDGASAGRFLLRRCPQQHWSEPAASQCTSCGSTDLHWAAAVGGATLVSWAVAWPAHAVLVIAELDEGPWWWSQLVDADPAALAVGDRLTVSFTRPEGEHEPVPVFQLAR